jgi:hypothetical protein
MADFALVLLVVCAQAADAQQPSLRTAASELGAYEEIVLISYPSVRLADLAAASELIVEVAITNEKSFLTPVGDEIWTDYSARIEHALDPRYYTRERTIVIRRRGGLVDVDGRRVRSLENGFSPFVVGDRYVLFLRKGRQHDAYEVVFGAAGAFEVTNGTVDGKSIAGFRDDIVRELAR